jgi:hypothetical protein
MFRCKNVSEILGPGIACPRKESFRARHGEDCGLRPALCFVFQLRVRAPNAEHSLGRLGARPLALPAGIPSDMGVAAKSDTIGTGQ